MRPMRLLHITPTFAPAVGGIEDVVANLARLSRRAGIEADVAHVAGGLGRSRRQEGPFSVMTLPLVGHRMLGFSRGLAELAAGYDLLHVHDPQVGALTMNISGSTAGTIPAVLSTHGGFSHTRKSRYAKLLHARLTAPRLLRRYSRILASSHSDLSTFQEYSPNVVLVENGVNTRKYATDPSAPRDMRRWIFWGRFSRNKRIDALIGLVSSLAREGIVIDLAICGNDFDGLLDSLKALVDKLGIGRHVSFRLGLDEAELRAEAATRGVFAIASEYEGFGLSILEAMAAGLVPACRDLAPMNALAGNTGLFLSFDGGRADVEAVKMLLSEAPPATDTRCGQAQSRARAFDWESRLGGFLEQYEACTRSP